LQLTILGFKVSTQDAVLLDHGFPPPDDAPLPVVVEFLLDVAHDRLIVTSVPLADGGVAFVNAIEVVFVPTTSSPKLARFRCSWRAASTWAARRSLLTTTPFGKSGPPIGDPSSILESSTP
jgi:hypothetical protein